jgi:hypothetical protein
MEPANTITELEINAREPYRSSNLGIKRELHKCDNRIIPTKIEAERTAERRKSTLVLLRVSNM